MTRIALARIALITIPVAAAVFAALTRESPPLHCVPVCGCGPSGTYSYAYSSPWCAQPMPAPVTEDRSAAESDPAAPSSDIGR